MQSRVIRGISMPVRPSKRHYERMLNPRHRQNACIREHVKTPKQQILDEESLHPYVMLSDLKLFLLFRQAMKPLSFLSVGLTP
jgi:hypothetical protein